MLSFINRYQRFIAKILSYSAMIVGAVALIIGVLYAFQVIEDGRGFNILCAVTCLLMTLKFTVDISKANLANDIFWITLTIIFAIVMLLLAL